jgi:hypothetical protein
MKVVNSKVKGWMLELSKCKDEGCKFEGARMFVVSAKVQGCML